MNKLTELWDIIPPHKFEGFEGNLTGWSWAALKTSFYIPELNILLDAGLPVTSIPEFIFITHGHGDHIYNLPMIMVEMGDVRPEIFVPEKILKNVFNFIDSVYKLSTCNEKPKIHNKYTLTGVVAGQILERNIKNKKYYIKIFNCYHTVPTVCYGFSEQRLKLKSEFLNLTGKQIGALKKSGVDINYPEQFHHFCYICDTSHQIFNLKKNPLYDFKTSNGEIYQDLEIFKYKTIIIECTFFEPDDLQQALDTRHLHWFHLEEIIKTHPDNTFILIHPSRRYKPDKIKQFFNLQPYKNMKFWV
jgi:ribonuclease Z